MFAIGVTITKDYGISYDEQSYRQHGFTVLNYLGEKILPNKLNEIKEKRNLEYTPIDQFHKFGVNTFKIQHTANATIEFLFFSNSEKKKVYLIRHYINFFAGFLALIIFYKILRLNYNKIISLTGVLFFITNPKFVAEIIYNPNDVWFMYFVIFFIFFSINYFKKRKEKYLYFVVVSIVLAINVRIIGLYLYPVFFIIYLINNNFKISQNEFKKLFKQLIVFLIILVILTPQLWYDPYSIFYSIFGTLEFKTFDPKILFLGNMLNSSDLPRYYLPLWILISTPLLVITLFTFGLLYFFKNIKIDLNKTLKKTDLIIFFLVFIIPLTFAVIVKPNLFNGWRHFYFIYPSIIYFGVYGIFELLNFIKSNKTKSIIIFVLIINFLNLISWSVKNHPYQNVFFNFISKYYADMFELDYWGLSNTNALKFISKLNEKDKINVAGIGNTKIDIAYNMLSEDEKNKINIVKISDNLDINYFITNFHDGKNEDYYLKNNYEIIKAIKVDKYPINLILKKK